MTRVRVREPFTIRDSELEVVRRLVGGLNLKQIASELGRTYPAVHGSVADARDRFGATSNEQLVAELFRRGVLQ